MSLPVFAWRNPTYPLDLPKGAIHLWKLKLNNGDVPLERYQAWLSADEQERAESFSYEEGRQKFIVSQAGLRFLIGQYQGNRPESVIFTYNPYGKPEINALRRGKSLQFNLTHSGDLALYAFAREARVGIDLELLSRRIEVKRMAPRVLSAAELESFNSLPENQQKEAYLLAWTQKEAYLKAIGTGLTREGMKITVDISPETHPAAEGKGLTLPARAFPIEPWQLFAFSPEAGAIGALAVESSPSEISGYNLLLDAEHLGD